MGEDNRRLECRFYKNDLGTEPVRDWLHGLEPAVRGEIGSDILAVQRRWPVSKPLVDGFGDGLYEVRTSQDGNIYRVFFMISDGSMILLHGFMKKTKTTPSQDIALARKRQAELRRSK